ncbi:MAG TPA: endonuclease V [bacterium]|nr:endonuclease V [bacterium]
MKGRQLHTWDLEPAAAIALQRELRTAVVVEPLAEPVTLVAGCDVSADRGSSTGYAGIVVLRLPDLAVVDRAGAVGTLRFPYIPGLLSFRESPLLLEAWERLQTDPDAVMVDGQGVAHPRRFGIACHFGLLIDRPTIGCAKTVLVGTYRDLGPDPGSTAPLVDRDEVIGAAVRTRRATAPVFVSVGHRVDLDSAVRLTLACRVLERGVEQPPRAPGEVPCANARYRIPEPTRQAHLFVNAMRRGAAQDTAFR